MERLNEAAAHAINSLPENEAEQFERSINSDRYLRDEFDSFRRVAADLANGLPDIVPAASPELWERISQETGITPRQETVAPVTELRPRRGLAYFATAAAAVAVAAVAVASMLAVRGPLSDTRSLAAAAAEQPASTSIELANPEGISGIAAEVIIAEDGTGYVVADSLPALTDDRTYQLWLIVDDQVISAGILGNDPEVVQFRAEGDIAGIAISNEVAGGVVVSEVAPVAFWLDDGSA